MGAAASVDRPAFLLLWNPDRFAWDDLPQRSYAWCVRQTALGRSVEFAWRIGHSRQLRRGDRLYLLRTGRQRGLIGAGWATDDVRQVRGKLAVSLRFDMLLPAEDVLPLAQLRRDLPDVKWTQQYASGNSLAPAIAARVERRWQRHLDDLGDPTRSGKALESGNDGGNGTGETQPEMALSIRQPHVEAILRGIKTAEYRNLSTTVRGRIHLYATKARYEPAEERAWLARYGLTDVDLDALPRGVLAGTVEIVDCVARRGGFAWQLARPQRAVKFRRPRGMPQPMWFRPF